MSKYTPTVVNALESHQKGDNENAKLLYVKALEENPYDAQALQLLGLILLMEKDYESALHLIKNSIAIDPTIFEAQSNLGHIYQTRNEYDLAFQQYKKALELRPKSALINNNIATIYKQKEDFNSALKYYQLAIKHDPGYIDAYINLTNLYYKYNHFKKAETVCKKVIDFKSHPSDSYITFSMILQILDRIDDSLLALRKYLEYNLDRFEVQITLAIYAWIANDMLACKSYLKMIRQVKFDDQNFFDRFIIAYKTFLEELIKYREANPLLYVTNEKLPVLYVIGDSHCLSYSNLEIVYRGKLHRVVSKIIMGCKAWHLSVSEKNKYKEQFENIILNLEEHADVLVIFGEIDCRLDDGIMKHYKHKPSNLTESIPKLVNQYIAHVSNLCNRKFITPLYSLVPAPYINEAVSLKEKEQLKKVIGIFNNTVSSILVKEQIYDVFLLTTNNNGESNKRYHIDRWHLLPETILNL